MVLESLSRLSLHDPTISLRVNRNTPDESEPRAVHVDEVGGLPLFQNDEVIIPGIVRELGFTLEDAGLRHHRLPGNHRLRQRLFRGQRRLPAARLDSLQRRFGYRGSTTAKPHERGAVLYPNGVFYEMQSIEEVKEAWLKLAKYFLKAQVSLNNYLESIVQYHTPHPMLSLSIEGCMESGRDCTWGGAKYNSYGGTATGLATVADSLTAIKYMVFDKKLISARELYDAVMANWEGYEVLRQRIISEVPHFGNADPYADEMMAWVINAYYEACKECYSSRTRIFKAGLYGAADHVGQGYTAWATPDGRKAGTPIADAASPVQGRDTNGPTAVFTSSLCYDHSKFMDGVCLNVRLHPTVLSREDGIIKLRDLVKAYMAAGGAETQFNVVSTETPPRRAGKARRVPQPRRPHRRVSAYFVELTRDCQDDLISRTENML